MIGEGTLIMVEAKTAARNYGDVFEAHPLLISGDGPASIAKCEETFNVVNTTPKRICEGDRVPAAKTLQGHFVTVSMQVGRAMSVVFTKNSAVWDVFKFWEGEDPEICGPPDMECLFDCSCLKDGDKVYARYSPEDDKYYGIASASALLGPPDDIEYIDGDQGLTFSAENCRNLEYQTKVAKAFICTEAPPTAKVAAWAGSFTQVLTSAGIVTDSYGNPCWQFTRAFALVCDSGFHPADPLLICGEECCYDVLHYKRFTSPNEMGPGPVHVGDYTDSYGLVDAIGEQCFAPGAAGDGWVQGAAEDLGAGFVRTTPSPECCPEEATP